MAPSSRPYPLDSSEAAHPIRRLSIRGVEEHRLGEFIGGQFGRWNLAAAMFEHKTDDKDIISYGVWEPEIHTKPTFEEASKQEYKPISKGYQFGPSW
jgi:alpha-mannosidase